MTRQTQRFTNKEVKTILSTMKGRGELLPTTEDGVEVGDVIRNTGLAHPGIVFRVDNDEVYYIVITTEVKSSAILKQCKSRLFSKSFFTVTIGVTNKQAAQQNVFAIYDNIGELKEVTKAIKAFYKTILSKQTTKQEEL